MINSSMQNLTSVASISVMQGGRTLADGGTSLPEAQVSSSLMAAVSATEEQKQDIAAIAAASAESMEAMAKKMNEMLQNMQRNLEFQVDSTSGKTVFRVIHGSTGEVIRQVPSEEALALAEALADGRAFLISDQA